MNPYFTSTFSSARLFQDFPGVFWNENILPSTEESGSRSE